MESDELIRKEQEIYALVEKLADEDNERYPIYDGINDIEQYLNAKYKILFILKEPYDGDGGTGGGWAIKNILGEGGYGKGSKTFYPLIYISYGILNDFCPWNNMDNVQDNFEAMNSFLYKVAHINISKLPSLNTTKTKMSDINNAYANDIKHDRIILKQIDAYKPDIIVGCGIGWLLFNDLELYQPENTRGYRSKKYPNLLYVATYHPANTTMGQEEYVDFVINLAKEHLSKK
jgi:hypothetical protein